MVVRRCQALIRNSDEAMDAVQDVFVNLLKANERGVTYPSSLLYTIATNVCLNRIRAKKREKWTDFLVEGEEFFAADDESYNVVDAQILVQSIFEDESEETRTICFMYHADGMTLKEISDAVGMSISGVQKRIETFKKRARLKLRDSV
jgi:RNA polymerase sigma-70 factor (ECF subfamily)